ncbi:tetratricopeptide repeat protein 28-like isoform X2 [Acropora muricata]|uniref:tetratricopeptide repeat protein 28-like isoform X2 n=1 Tax=Acropora muricata TaxID=159855 RepID=UPI0034E3EA19
MLQHTSAQVIEASSPHKEPLYITLLASEWNSLAGGLSTLNREFAIHLAECKNVRVTLLVPEGACNDRDKKEAQSLNINVVEAKQRLGCDPLDWLGIPAEGHRMDVVVGHGVKLGWQVHFIKNTPQFRNCKWVHMVHTAPEDLSKHKGYENPTSRGEQKHWDEVGLCKCADLVVPVGPKLMKAYFSYLQGCKKGEDIFGLTPGLFYREFGDIVQTSKTENDDFKVLLCGRGDNEDFELKGYDIAVKAFADPRLKGKSYHLVFVGAPDGMQDEVRKRLLNHRITEEQLTVRKFVQSRSGMKELLCEVDLAIMPSKCEGYGLVALEALSAGLPVLVGSNSGFASAIRDLPLGACSIVDSYDPAKWAEAIERVRVRHGVCLKEIKMLRECYGKEYVWKTQCEALVERLWGMISDDQGTSISQSLAARVVMAKQDVVIPERTSRGGLRKFGGRQDVGSEGQQSLRKYGELVIKLLIDANNTLKEKEKEEIKKTLTKLVQTCDDQSRDLRCLTSFTNTLTDIYEALVLAVGEGSVVVSLRCPTLASLEHLWSDYRSGDLDKLAERYLVTDDMKKKLKLETSYLKITIDEKNCLNCKKAFMGLPDTCSENPGKDLLHPSETTTTEEKRQSTDVPEISSEGRSLLEQERRPLLLHPKALPLIKEQRHDTDTRRGKQIAFKALVFGSAGPGMTTLGDIQKAIEYHEKHLEIAKEVSDRVGEGRAYESLGNDYQSLGDFRKAIEYHEKRLEIAIEVGHRVGEGNAYGSLGNAYQSLGDFQKAIEYQEKHLEIAREVGHWVGEGNAYGSLGSAYQALGDFRKAIEYHEKSLKIAREVGHRVGEGNAYGSLGSAYQALGDFRKAIEYHEKSLKIAREVGHRVGEGNAYGSLGSAYQALGDFRKAIEYHEKSLKIAREVGHRVGEGNAYGNLGNDYQSLGDFRKAIEYHEKHLEIAIEVGHRVGEGNAYGSLGTAYQSLGDFQKGIEYHEKHLEIAIEIGHRAGEGISHHNIGNAYFCLGQFENALDKFGSAVETFNTLRSFLKSEDDWKINFRELHDKSYCATWRSLLRIGKIDEALFAADEGRAQTLSDNLWIQYKLALPSSDVTDDSKERISRFLTELSIPIIFLATEGLAVNIWFLSRGKEIAFRERRLEASITGKDPIRVLLEAILEKIRPDDSAETCEDNEVPSSGEVCGEEVGNPPLLPSNNAFKPFYDAVIGPIEDLLGPEDDELVIVSDGALCFIPWAAVIESIRIRIVPSLKSYQLISSVPEGYHKRRGALLVGNPCLEQLKNPLHALPCAQKEVEMIAAILNTRPLIGKQATKAEVMKRMSSVGLIHIAAHGDAVTGKIALSPNPGWTQFPKEEDYILKMSDVQAANLRARLVVLSCCHSGRGRILKGEGVVGIARAFLAAGARSVLVALWAIDDEATMEFMKCFYQHMKDGKTTSAAVHQSMQFLRESEEFSEMWYWAPFQLIGDDVKIEFDANGDVSE